MSNAITVSIDVLEQQSWDWLNSCDVVANKDRQWHGRVRAATLAAYAFGYGGHERTRLATDFIMWLFLFDDAYAENTLSTDPLGLRKQHKRYDAILKGDFDGGPKNPFGRALSDIFKRLSALAPRDFALRLGASIRSYFDGCELETTYRMRGTPLSIESYLWLREHSVGVYPMLDCVEFAGNSYVTAEEMTNPCVAGLRRSAVLVTALTNDLYSSAKEEKEVHAFNAVLVYERQHRISRDEALADIVALQHRFRQEFEHYASVCRVDASPGLRHLIDGIPTWIDGNHRWSTETPRYHDFTVMLESFRPPPSAPTPGMPFKP